MSQKEINRTGLLGWWVGGWMAGDNMILEDPLPLHGVV